MERNFRRIEFESSDRQPSEMNYTNNEMVVAKSITGVSVFNLSFRTSHRCTVKQIKIIIVLRFRELLLHILPEFNVQNTIYYLTSRVIEHRTIKVP